MRRSMSVSWESKPLPPRMGGVLMVLIGLAFLIGSWLWRERLTEFIASASHAEGTVTEMERSGNSNSHFPVFIYKDAEGHGYEVRSSYPSDSLRVGDTAEVSYDPASPYEAVLSDLASRSKVQLVIAGMGAAFLVAGVLLIWSHNWWTRMGRNGRADSEQAAADGARNADI